MNPVVRDALHLIGWREVRTGMLLGLAISAWSLTLVIPEILFATRTMPWWTPIEHVIGDQFRAVTLVIVIAIADRLADEGAPRRRTYVLATLAGWLAGFAASQPLHWVWRLWVLPNAWPEQWFWLNGTSGHVFWSIAWLLQWLPIAGAVVFLHATRRAALKTARLLHEAELDRIRRSRVALESRLQAMQARVEPRFLFNTLAQVAHLYHTRASQAGRMLEDLIAYLRASMPKMREGSSTVGQEVELARAYLDIVRHRLGERLRVSIDVPESARDEHLPPMMLLPLVDHAVARGLDGGARDGTIAITAALNGGRLRMSVVDRGAGLMPDAEGEGIAAIRQRLDALYGGEATLDMRPAGERATEAVLDLPLAAHA